jgi:hypothetical protein
MHTRVFWSAAARPSACRRRCASRGRKCSSAAEGEASSSSRCPRRVGATSGIDWSPWPSPSSAGRPKKRTAASSCEVSPRYGHRHCHPEPRRARSTASCAPRSVGAPCQRHHPGGAAVRCREERQPEAGRRQLEDAARQDQRRSVRSGRDAAVWRTARDARAAGFADRPPRHAHRSPCPLPRLAALVPEASVFSGLRVGEARCKSRPGRRPPPRR